MPDSIVQTIPSTRAHGSPGAASLGHAPASTSTPPDPPPPVDPDEPPEPPVAPLPELDLSASLLDELLELGLLEELGGVAEELEELEPDGGVLGVTVAELDEELEPDGVDGVVVAPLPEVDEERSAAGRSGPRSQPPIKVAPSARETATARLENFMWPPWLGTRKVEQDTRRAQPHDDEGKMFRLEHVEVTERHKAPV